MLPFTRVTQTHTHKHTHACRSRACRHTVSTSGRAKPEANQRQTRGKPKVNHNVPFLACAETRLCRFLRARARSSASPARPRPRRHRRRFPRVGPRRRCPPDPLSIFIYSSIDSRCRVCPERHEAQTGNIQVQARLTGVNFRNRLRVTPLLIVYLGAGGGCTAAAAVAVMATTTLSQSARKF